MTTDHQDSLNKIIFSGQVVLATSGFAPIPAFSFDAPISIGSISIKKKRFSYQPDFALGLNGKPWMSNHWFRFILYERGKYKFHIGTNPSLFFKNERIDSKQEIVHAHRNFTVELEGTKHLSKKILLTITYMHIKAFDAGTLSGDFIDLSLPVTGYDRPRSITLMMKPQLFYFNFEGNVDGFFVSNTLSLAGKIQDKVPLSIYVQGVLPIWTGFSGNMFKWNAGLGYAF